MKVKRFIYNMLVLAAVLALISGCTEETSSEDTAEQELRFFNIYMSSYYPDAEPQASGLFYLEHTEGSGEMPGPEDWVKINHVAYTIPDNAVYDSYIENVAIDNRFYDAEAMYGPYKTKNGVINEGLTEGLSLMREGGEATLMFTSDLGFGEKNSGSVGSYRSLKYEIELLEVLGDIDVYEQGKIDTYLDTVAQFDTVYDADADLYFHYILDLATDGAPVGIDSSLEVSYTGYLMDGRVFDQSESFKFSLATTEWIARWDLVLPRLKEGEKVRMIFPYGLAYGPNGEATSSGKVKIPPYETLLFDVEILSVEAEIEVEDPGDGE